MTPSQEPAGASDDDAPVELHPSAADPAATRYTDDPLATRYTDDPLATRYTDAKDARPSAPAGQPTVPGYEILGELGRGGMGVVYKARQVGLNRVVALKMILSGEHAGAEELVRLRAEAEAVARLQHPNIVQIHEIAEHEGRPFFSMEFCPDGGLDRKLGGTPLPPAEAARLVETLARAVHAAHRQNVIHRDLKPANVLLAEDGTPKVTDFGLAKRTDAAARTVSGGFVGTPSYAAPEQAAGRSKDIGPATDVYALGAILYECLTGRPPFKAATALDTLAQVLVDDPVPPRRLQPKTPRYLETICLKCLQKDPKRRYTSADRLGHDLRRFQAGEPVLARPVGLPERIVRWVRRRPAVAALTGLLAATLAAGIGVSCYLAGMAIDRLDLYKKESQKSANLLQESREQTAEGFMRPLGAGVGIDPNEFKAIWDLSRTPPDQESVRFLFVERALDKPDDARRFWSRAPMALRAAVGLDVGRRKEMLKRLRSRLEAAERGSPVRTACAVAAADLAPPDGVYADEVADVLLDALGEPPNPAAQVIPPPLADSLGAVAGRMDAAAARCAAQRLLGAMDQARDTDQLLLYVDSLCALVPHLVPATAREVAGKAGRKVVDALARASDLQGILFLPGAVGALAPLMDESTAHQLAEESAQQFLDAWTGPDTAWIFGPQGMGWYRIAPFVDAATAKAAAPRLLAGLDLPPVLSSQLAGVLGAIAHLLEETDADAAGRRVAAAVEKTDDPDLLAVLADWFAAVAPRMSRPAANQAAAAVMHKVVKTLATTRDFSSARFLSGALGPVAPYLTEQEADAAGAAILTAMDKAGDAEMLASLAGGFGKPAMIAAGKGFGSVSPNPPGVSSHIAGPALGLDIRQLFGDPSSPAGLGAVLPRMTDGAARKTAAAAARKVFDALSAASAAPDVGPAFFLSGDPSPGYGLCNAAAALAPGLNESEADEAARLVLHYSLSRVQPGQLNDPLEPLKALGPRMSLAAADAAGEEIAVTAEKHRSLKPPDALAGAFDAVACRMDASAARASAKRLLEVWSSDELDAPTVEILLAHLDAEAAHRAAVPVGQKLIARFVAGGYSPAQLLMVSQNSFPDAFQKVTARLSRQELVELLKEPASAGAADTVILEQLGRSTGRRLYSVWDFVEWEEVNNPSLDLRSAPTAPEPQVQPPVLPAFNPPFNPLAPG